jgi:hypothetical protein
VIKKIEMPLLYGKSGENSVIVQQLYAERYPENVQLSQQMFLHSLRNISKAGVKFIRLKLLNPHLSTQQTENYSGVSKTSVVSLIRTVDFQNHAECCHWTQQQLQIN